MMLESYSTAGISITQSITRRLHTGGFTRLLCSEKNGRIMQPMKTKLDDVFISWIIGGNKRTIFHETWIS